jgi:uncharacterized protein (TIGR02246 family)
MSNRLILLTASALLLTSCDAGTPPADSPPGQATALAGSSADEEAIRAKVDLWHQLIKSRDSAAIAQLYTDDGAVMPPNTAIGIGQGAIQQTWDAMMQTPGFDLAIVPEQIVVSSSGDMAMDRGTYRLAVAPEGVKTVDTGKYVVVWRKVDGEWKAAADIFNSDLPAVGG